MRWPPAQALGIVLTKRGKHLGEDIPMCGVPIHRADEYLQRLIRQGFRVAVCEQLEDPAEARKRGSKAVVRRDVVRLVTPGTLTEDSLLDAKARNYLTAVFKAPRRAAAGRRDRARLARHLDRRVRGGRGAGGRLSRRDRAAAPSEVIAADALLAEARCANGSRSPARRRRPFRRLASTAWPASGCSRRSCGVADLAAFGDFSRAELAAIGALLKYVELTQIGRRPCLRPPRAPGPPTASSSTRRRRASLELLRSLSASGRAACSRPSTAR